MKKHHLEPIMEIYLKEKHVSEKTKKAYRIAFKYYVMYLKVHKIKYPQTKDVIAFRNVRREQGFSPSYQYVFMSAIKGFYQYLKTNYERLGLSDRYQYDVTEPIKNTHVTHHLKKRVLTKEEAKRFILCMKAKRKYMHHYRDHAIITLMLTAGLSPHEIIHAKRHYFKYKDGKRILYLNKKGERNFYHKIELSDMTYHALRDYVLKRDDDNPYLFMSHRNVGKTKHLSRTFFRDMFRRILISCGFDPRYITPNALRHSAALFNLSRGASIEETKALLRHTYLNSTKVYETYLSRMKNDSEEKIEALLFSDDDSSQV